MEASSQRTRQVCLALALIPGVACVAACVAAFMWWKAPVASAQVVASPEAVFVTRCNYSHTNTDDPIVFPGQRGAAHSHDFFANRSTKYNSTYVSLRAFKGTTRATKSGTTCVNAADKSATGFLPRAGPTKAALASSNPAPPTSTIGRAARGM